MSSSWEKQLNLIVSYFVRVHFENEGNERDFPMDLKNEIRKFASRRVDIWYSKIIGPGIEIEGSLAKINNRSGWRSAYSTYTCNVKDGECIEWALRLKTRMTGSFYISIIKDDEKLLNDRKTFTSWGSKDNDKYIYCACYGYSRLASDRSVQFPGDKFGKEGDTLVIVVDENRKISMKINDRDYGFVPNFKLQPLNYRLAVHTTASQTCEIEFY